METPGLKQHYSALIGSILTTIYIFAINFVIC
jgi:hypothetical protein